MCFKTKQGKQVGWGMLSWLLFLTEEHGAVAGSQRNHHLIAQKSWKEMNYEELLVKDQIKNQKEL